MMEMIQERSSCLEYGECR